MKGCGCLLVFVFVVVAASKEETKEQSEGKPNEDAGQDYLETIMLVARNVIKWILRSCESKCLLWQAHSFSI